MNIGLEYAKTLPVFQNVEENILNVLGTNLREVKIAKSDTLFLQQSKAEYFYIVKFGKIKLFRETFNGDEAIIDIMGPGHVFGETSMFSDGQHDYGAGAIESSVLYTIPLNHLKQALEKSSKLSYNFFALLAQERILQDDQIEHLNLQNAPQRIGCFLLQLCGKKTNGPITLHLPYDKFLIASRLGMKPETFSRALSTLKKESKIQVKGGTIEVPEIANLSDYCCSACTQTFPCADHKIKK